MDRSIADLNLAPIETYHYHISFCFFSFGIYGATCLPLLPFPISKIASLNWYNIWSSVSHKNVSTLFEQLYQISTQTECHPMTFDRCYRPANQRTMMKNDNEPIINQKRHFHPIHQSITAATAEKAENCRVGHTQAQRGSNSARWLEILRTLTSGLEFSIPG